MVVNRYPGKSGHDTVECYTQLVNGILPSEMREFNLNEGNNETVKDRLVMVDWETTLKGKTVNG